MPQPLGWIRQFHRSKSPDNPLLLVFPHAGSGASAYRDFSKCLGSRCNVLVFQYPGRQDRASEAPLNSLAAMAAGAFDDFCTSGHHRGRSILTFGHSMGALVAFEFVRIAEAVGMEVRALTASAAVAPSQVAAKPPHPSSEEDILVHLASLEGTDADVFAHREVMRLSLPVIKADYRAFDAYTCSDDVKIAAPVHAIGGDQDPYVTLGDLYGWGKHSESLDVTVFDGGHFYLNDHLDAVAELVTR
ncbi:thioesterase [Mycolicibacterium sp. GF69]|uniref:thioesterase II family protein n=1 Tax=Mycolicibacterium sp. GF69 TaxID=2267251 RepID=UPI000DCE9C44|nr:alpha/beta fold hydrolase [Mycolicibacterium sp. GF69]MBY0288865.1 alpha/beta fold hydrolase [Mycobacteriaceae bacterium]RAV07378.1 thioesterase [Mycolicibacterium sp. GF69]